MLEQSKKNKYILYKNLPKRPILDKYFLFLFPFPKQEPGDIFSIHLEVPLKQDELNKYL